MGTAERKNREKEQRRLLIITAAEKIFIKKGLVATTMDEIADACELSKGTLYLYFKSKDELYYAIMINILKNFVRIVETNLAKEKDYERRLNSLGNSYLKFYKEYPSQFAIMNDLDVQHDKMLINPETEAELFSSSGRIWQIVEAVIEEGIDLGRFRKDINPMEIGVMIWASSTGMIRLIEHIRKSHGFCPDIDRQVAICQFSEMDYELMLNKLWSSIFDSIRIKPLKIQENS